MSWPGCRPTAADATVRTFPSGSGSRGAARSARALPPRVPDRDGPGKAGSTQETAWACRDQYLGAPVESVEGRKIEMVVMSVGNEDQVDAVEACRVDRGLTAEVEDPVAEHGVRDDEEIVELDRGAAMPEPRERSRSRLGRFDAERTAGRGHVGEPGSMPRRDRASACAIEEGDHGHLPPSSCRRGGAAWSQTGEPEAGCGFGFARRERTSLRAGQMLRPER